MERYELYIFLASAIPTLFVFALGACVGSLLNVVAYRLPLGISIVTPPSRCPSCGTRLTWRENIPVLGWLLLKGKCRFCRSKISAEYPLVEFAVGLLFATFYVAFFVMPGNFQLMGVHLGSVRPPWTLMGFLQVWPAFVVLLVLLGCLAAMTLTDAKTYTIPLVLTWIPAAVAVLVHPLHAAWIQHSYGRLRTIEPGWWWVIPTPGPGAWWWIGAALGGVAGIGLAQLLLHLGFIRRSFADYDEWERSVGPKDDAAHTAEDQADLWVQYPHARREVLKEVLFLAPCIGLFALGGWLATMFAGPWQYDPETMRTLPAMLAPLWLQVLAGVCMGYLIGGGVVWAFRIFGTLMFGKEAMGLGDVHMMAAVGACLGWIDAALAVPIAAVVGLLLELLGRLRSGGFRRAMPFGPSLAIATILVLLAKPLLELGLGLIVTGGGDPGITVRVPLP